MRLLRSSFAPERPMKPRSEGPRNAIQALAGFTKSVDLSQMANLVTLARCPVVAIAHPAFP